MPLVFVHGVSVRAGESYDRQLEFRNAAFRRHVLPDPAASIYNPYWGAAGAKAAWHHASLPGEPVLRLDALGPQDSVTVEQVLISEEAAGHSHPRTVLLEVARQDFPEAIELLVSTAIEQSGLPPEELVSIAVVLEAYAKREPQPTWVFEVTHDYEFLERLRREARTRLASASAPHDGAREAAAAWSETVWAETTWDGLRVAIDRIREAIADWRWGQPGRSLRRTIQPYVTNFFGDIFVYLVSRGTREQPGDIVRPICEALETAAGEATEHDPLLVVAHSMGANIAFDAITSFCPHVQVETLITVGNQIGWFEEMKLFVASDHDIPNAQRPRAPKPANVRRWLNVMDASDYLAYSVEPIFEGASDISFASGRGPLAAHTEYFKNIDFYLLLGEQVNAGVEAG